MKVKIRDKSSGQRILTLILVKYGESKLQVDDYNARHVGVYKTTHPFFDGKLKSKLVESELQIKKSCN